MNAGASRESLEDRYADAMRSVARMASINADLIEENKALRAELKIM